MFWILNRLAKDKDERAKRHPEVEEPLEKLLRDKLSMWEISPNRDQQERNPHYHD